MRFLPVQQWLSSFNDWVGPMGTVGILVFIVVYALATVLLARQFLDADSWHSVGVRTVERFSGGLDGRDTRRVPRLSRRPVRCARQNRINFAKRNEKFPHLDNAIGKQGAKLIFLLRLSPVIRLNLVSATLRTHRREVLASTFWRVG